MFTDIYQTLASVSMLSPMLLSSANILQNDDFQSNMNYASTFDGLGIFDPNSPIPTSASQYLARPVQQPHGHASYNSPDCCLVEGTSSWTPLSTPTLSLDSGYFYLQSSPSIALKPTSQDLFLCESSSNYTDVLSMDKWEDEGRNLLGLANHTSSLISGDETDLSPESFDHLYPSDYERGIKFTNTINEPDIPSLLPFLSCSPELRKLQKNEQLAEGIVVEPQYLVTEYVGSSYQVIKLEQVKQDPTFEDDRARAIVSSTDSNSLASPACPTPTGRSVSLSEPAVAAFSPIPDAFRGIELCTLQSKAIRYQARNPSADFDKSWLLQFAGRLSTEGQHTPTYRCYVIGCQQTNKRKDHILTHVGSHLNHKTFRCQYWYVIISWLFIKTLIKSLQSFTIFSPL